MKVARIIMKSCQRLQRIQPSAYIGYQIHDDTCVEHLLLSRNNGHTGSISLRVSCGECLFCHFVRTTKIVSTPTLYGRDKIKFTVIYDKRVKRLLSKYKDRVEEVEIYDYRSMILTDRQKQVILAAAHEGISPSRLAEKLGVSRQAAGKLLKKAMIKIAKTVI